MPLHPRRNDGPFMPDTRRLVPGCALTIRPRESGVLRIGRGSAWVTLDGPHPVHPRACGDRVLGPGDTLPLARGQRVVIEAWDRDEPVWFAWSGPCFPRG